MIKNLNLQNNVQDEIVKPAESMEVRLCSLAATCFNFAQPIGPTQQHFYANRTTVIQGMNPADAYNEFSKLCKQYQRQQVLTGHLEQMRQASAVVVAPTYVQPMEYKADTDKFVPGTIIRIVLGNIADTVSPDQNLARTVADVLTVHSTCEEKKMTTTQGVEETVKVVKALTTDQCKEALLYSLDAGQVRNVYSYVGSSNQTTRDGMFKEMTADLSAQGEGAEKKRGQAKANILMLMDMLARQVTDMYRVPMSQEEVAIYNEYKLPQAPKKDKMFKFSFSKYRLVKGMTDHTKAWTHCIKQWQHTGAGKENLFAGYSLMDCTPGYLKHVEEAFDIMQIAQTFGFAAVRLAQANLPLTEILLASGVSVYDQTHGHGVHESGDPIGHYYKGKAKCFTWIHSQQVRPVIKGTSINMPPRVTFYDDVSFGYEYIPATAEKGYYYLPSIKAANGLCVTTNCNVGAKVTVSISDLVDRFFTALTCRSQYIYTRINFPSIDPMDKFFTATIVLPKINKKENKIEGLDQLGRLSTAMKWDEAAFKTYQQVGMIRYDVVQKKYSLFDQSQATTLGQRKPGSQVLIDFKAYIANKDMQWTKNHVWAIAHGEPVSDPELLRLVAVMERPTVLKTMLSRFVQIHKSVTFQGPDITTWDPKVWKKYLDAQAKAQEAKNKNKKKEKKPDEIKTPPTKDPPPNDDEGDVLSKGFTMEGINPSDV